MSWEEIDREETDPEELDRETGGADPEEADGETGLDEMGWERVEREEQARERTRRRRERRRREKRRKIINLITLCVLIAAAGVFIFSGLQLYRTWKEYHTGEKAYENLAARFPTLPEAGETQNYGTSGENGGTHSDREIENSRDWQAFYREMKELNPDYIGWIVIEDTSINYPIVQAADNDYYLHRLFDGTDNFAGSIFADYRCANCFAEGNTILYGHNMKNGSMFAGLLNYRNNEFYQNHKTFSIYTEEGELTYEVFAIYATDPVSDTYTISFASGDSYVSWLERMHGQSTVNPEVEFTADTAIVTLSTCINNMKDRLIVQARRVTE